MKLLPCQFCGGEARHERIGEYDYFMCDPCRIDLATVEKWNRRAAPATNSDSFSSSLVDSSEQPEQPEQAVAPNNSQDWAKLSGASAYIVIERHADSWADIERMMTAWRNARPALTDEQIREIARAAFSRIENASRAYHNSHEDWNERVLGVSPEISYWDWIYEGIEKALTEALRGRG